MAALRADAEPFVPRGATVHDGAPPTETDLITNKFGQRTQFLKKCMTPGLHAFLEMSINLTPHPINYFKVSCDSATPAFSMESYPGYEVMRPPTDDAVYARIFDEVDLYHESIYGSICNRDLTSFLERFADATTCIFIMSAISAKSLISAFSSECPPPPGLVLLTPRTTGAVRDAHGTIIGVSSFNIVWNRGVPVPRR